MMEDLLKAMLNGAGSQPQGNQAGDDPLTGLLGGILGAGSEQGAGDMGDLLGGLLGGGSQQGAGGAADILGAVLGGGQAGPGANPLLAPVADGIAEKLGLPPEIAHLVVTFVLGKLLSGRRGGRPALTGRSGLTSQQEGLDLDDLLERMGGSQGLDVEYLQSTGMADELSQQTGLDADTAARGLQEAFQMLGGQFSSGQGNQE